MPVTPYVPEPRYSRKTDPEATNGSKAKRKRNADIQRNVPALACMGFIRASDLTGKSSKKRKTTEPEEKDFDMQGVDDDTDKELESGMIVPAPRRTKSSAASTSKPKMEKKTRVRRAATHDGGSKNVKSKKKPDKAKSGGFFESEADDPDDSDIKSPPKTPKTKKREGSKEKTSSPTKPSEASPKRAKRVTRQQPEPSPADAVINITDSEPDVVELTASHPPSTSQHISDDLSWVVQDDDEMDIDIASPSPLAVRSKAEVPSQIIDPSSLSPAVRGTKSGQQWGNDCNGTEKRDQGGQLHDSFTEGSTGRNGAQPEFSAECIASSSPGLPIATFPVHRAGKGRSKNIQWDANVNIESSPCEEVPLKRLRRHPPSSTPVRRKKKQKMTAFEAQDNPLFDVVANHSGDEVSEGGSNSEDYVETESDRAFIKNSPLTQAPGFYEQSQVYRRSLFTQVPGQVDPDMPEFAQGPSRPNLFRRQRARLAIQPSSSPVRGSDDYEFGSFVVRDDAEISFEA